MGYLDNSSITVDAILTKKGRELLSRNDGSFNITSFALGDDEIDYSLFNENHPNGSQYAGEAIENMPILEAFPDENNIMRHKLITLNKNVTKIPYISVSTGTINISKGGQADIKPETINIDGSSGASIETLGYMFTVKDRRLFQSFTATGQGNAQSGTTETVSSNVAVSETVIGNELTIKALSSDALFGTHNKLITTITIEGRSTGARTTIPVTINKVNATNPNYQDAQSGVETK